VPGTYPRPQSRYLCTGHGKPILKLHHWSTRATCGARAGAAGLTLTGAAPGTYPRPRSTHIGRAHTRRGQCLVHTHGPSHEQPDHTRNTIRNPTDLPGAGRSNGKAPEKKSHAEHSLETHSLWWSHSIGKWVNSPAAQHREPVNPPDGISPIRG